jgi:hypothetical protein
VATGTESDRREGEHHSEYNTGLVYSSTFQGETTEEPLLPPLRIDPVERPSI